MDGSFLFPFPVCFPLAGSFCHCETFPDARRCLSISWPILVITYQQKLMVGDKILSMWIEPIPSGRVTMSYMLQYHVWVAGWILNVNFGENTSSNSHLRVPSDHLKSQALGKIATTVGSWVQLNQQCPWEIKVHSEDEQHQGRADRTALNKTSKHLFIFYPVIKLNISKLFQGHKAYHMCCSLRLSW